MPSSAVWKVAIVGTGNIAGGSERPSPDGPVKSHAQALHRHPRFSLHAAVNPNETELRAFERTWKVPRVFPAMDDLLAEAPVDVIVLCTPDALHFAQARAVLEADERPRVLVVEKPVCTNADQLEELLALAPSSGVVLVVNHGRRVDPAHRRLSQRVRGGDLGRLVQGRWTYYGGWLHNGVHAVDTLRMLFGAEPECVSARLAGSGRPDDADLHVKLRIAGAPLTLEPFDERHYQLFEAELRFERGRAWIRDFGERLTVEHVAENARAERELVPEVEEPSPPGLDSPLSHLLDAVDGELRGDGSLRAAGVDLETAAGTMRLMFEACAVAQGRPAEGRRQ